MLRRRSRRLLPILPCRLRRRFLSLFTKRSNWMHNNQESNSIIIFLKMMLPAL